MSAGVRPASPTTLPIPSSTPCAWFAGVDEVFVKWMRFVAASNRTRSVKVPPTSTPRRTLMGAEVWHRAGHGSSRRRAVRRA